MIKRVFAATTLAVVLGLTTGAMAQEEPTNQPTQQPAMDESGNTMGQPMREEEVRGLSLVPSTRAQQVFMSPTAWFLREHGNMANANAKVYTNREGAITGVTVTAWGLPNPERINPSFNDYVVWLLDSKTGQRRNIGVLESRNGGEAVFGYSPEQPLIGFDRIVISPEPTFATRSMHGWQQLAADLPQTAMAPGMMNTPGTMPQRP